MDFALTQGQKFRFKHFHDLFGELIKIMKMLIYFYVNIKAQIKRKLKKLSFDLEFYINFVIQCTTKTVD